MPTLTCEVRGARCEVRGGAWRLTLTRGIFNWMMRLVGSMAPPRTLHPAPCTLHLSQRGTALIEAALTLPMLLLVAVGIFEFGRAYQTWQVLTNAAREGARVAVLPGSDSSVVESRVRAYMQSGQLPGYGEASIDVNRGASISVGTGNASASQVTVDYPFEFIVLQPVARLIVPETSLGGPLTMRASALMRNEAQ